MTDRELRQMLEAMRIPMMIADGSGGVLMENMAWVDLRKTLQDGFDAELKNAVLQAEGTGTEQILKISRQKLLVTPLSHDRFLIQMQGEPIEHLKRQYEDTVQTTSAYQETLSSFGIHNCIATSDSMIRIFMKAKQVAAYPTTILLLGETGVGKEVVSSYIHHNSDRNDKPFIKINCSAIPEPLMEAELFGYERGAFTGAREKGKMGLFELANHGTILLDEIGDMSFALQAKLLRTIQESEIMRVGGTQPIHLDVRIISATSRDIEEMVSAGRFLDALYYRLNVVELQIPPLRERREDIIPLAEFYLQHFCETYKLEREFSPDVRTCFLRYDWPGNVRELRNTVENLVVSAISTVISWEDLPTRIARLGRTVPTRTDMPGGISMKAAVEALQREMIQAAVAREGSLRKAAAALEMDATTLCRLAKKLGVEP
ncbi:sigma-54 interaction domain-containing protein [Dysosmobacter sp.]|uniref:sigma-54 interaction domain-containing protein n=1 Tax=Dysosmobacter sp. TaxID=2591382 RepID=UPI003AB33FDA